MQNNKQGKKQDGKFVAALKAIFVHNIGWKILALVSSAAIWFLATGLL